MTTRVTGNLLALTDNYGVGDDANPWSNNILAGDTVRHASGAFGRRGEPDESTSVDEATVAATRRIADEVAALMIGTSTGMGSQGSEELEAFWACSTPDRIVTVIDDAAVSALFGRALVPNAVRTIAPISTETEWWKLVEQDCDGDDVLLSRWRKLLAWFGDRSRFEEAAFVAIDPDPDRENGDDLTSGGCVFPRLWLGRTGSGALAGLLGVVVYT
jgi:hypothetical protein